MKTYKWVVEIGVTENWVDDGFDMTDDSAHEMLATFVPYAYGHELEARVLKPLSDNEILDMSDDYIDNQFELAFTGEGLIKFVRAIEERYGIK